ncbi:MAG: type II secretion system protein [Planctomycetota bacterium]|jgi:prepilin-type N-terminal cleavage/methylation domain-containing protein
MYNPKGFTLIELLVVISIIALLMAILMPTLSRTKELAGEAVCMANLKQWGVGYAMYYNENDYLFPRNGWIWIPSKGEDDSMSYGFDKKLLLCPRAIKTSHEGGNNPFVAWTFRNFNGSYGASSWCGWDRGPDLANTDDSLWIHPMHKNSDKIPVFMDCFHYNIAPLYYDAPPKYNGEIPNIIHFGGWGGSHNPDAMKSVCIDRHRSSINVLFVDFGTRKVGLKELWELKWHKTWEETMQGQSPPIWPYWMRNFKDYRAPGAN